MNTTSIRSILDAMQPYAGRTVAVISDERPVLLIFLRHFGCIFCQESLKEIAKTWEKLSPACDRLQLVFIHMADARIAQEYFQRFDLSKALHVSDPEKKFYDALGLQKGSLTQLFGLKNWMNGFSVITSSKVSPALSQQLGDPWQMPGIFLVYQGEIHERFVHDYASEKPDYEKLLQRCEQLSAEPSAGADSTHV